MRYIFIALLLFSTSAFATEPTNLDLIKKQLMHYHDSGSYLKQITAVDHQAQVYIQERVLEPHIQKLAIVFDIDETSLSNYPAMVDLNFGGTLNMINQDISEGNDIAIKPTLDLYYEALKDHIAVFFITGRHQDIQDPTIKNLIKAGFSTWQGIYFKPNDYKEPSVTPYKSGIRRQIESEGYDIIVNIGDQQSDLAGGYADKAFKLPNPYYYIP